MTSEPCKLSIYMRADLPNTHYSSIFIVSAGIVIQGETEAELPEHVLACAALKYIDVERHSPLESFPF